MHLRWKNGRHLFCGAVYVGEVLQLRPCSHKWRAWLMVGRNGEEVGRFDTWAEAAQKLQACARVALSSGGEPTLDELRLIDAAMSQL